MRAGFHAELNSFDKLFASIILFAAGWYLCLPVATHIQLPWWASKITISSTILLHEALYVLYLGAGGAGAVLQNLTRRSFPTRVAAIWLIGLAVWCGVISLSGPLPAQDVGRSARLVVMALLLVSVTRWAMRDAAFVLRFFLLGLITGAMINLWFTFHDPLIVQGLPRLLGQNTPGPAMGLGVSLAAWLLLIYRNQYDLLLSIAVAMVCSFGALISYSRIGIFAVIVGILGYALVALTGVSPRIRSKQLIKRVAIGVIVVALAGFVTSQVQVTRDLYVGMQELLYAKFESVQSADSHSNQHRISYLFGVMEIIGDSPQGVGYSGFRDAMMRTDIYGSGRAADESLNDISEANPHALFLYYTSAGGVVGGFIAVIVFLLLSSAVIRGLRDYGIRGRFLGMLVVSVFVVMGISVPYGFSSVIMIVPAGVASGIGLRQWALAHSSLHNQILGAT